ncbi:matrix metalloproteinase-23 [Nematostella vectensis]|nr:matrix metalloproteinase-23 [Nematostella vectensis]
MGDSFGWHTHAGVPQGKECSDSFDSWNGVLAHAFFPPDGRIHFDEYEWWHPWQKNVLFRAALPMVAAHEIGHALGLEHSSVKESLMWASCCQSTLYHLRDDISGILSLYGYGPQQDRTV